MDLRRLVADRNLQSIEVEVAKRFFEWGVFGFLQAFGEFAGEDVLLRTFGFDRGAEFGLDGVGLFAQKTRGVIQVDRGGPHRRDMREHDAESAID